MGEGSLGEAEAVLLKLVMILIGREDRRYFVDIDLRTRIYR